MAFTTFKSLEQVLSTCDLSFEISFGELRRTYEEVRKFLIEDLYVEDTNFGLYATIDEDLDLFDVDFETEFCKKFSIDLPNMKIDYSELIKRLILNVLKMFLMLPIMPLVVIYVVMALIINLLFSKEIEKTSSKKQWQKDQLTVADLVSSAVAKRFVQKKEIVFVLKK
jgi:hypothetical protein